MERESRGSVSVNQAFAVLPGLGGSVITAHRCPAPDAESAAAAAGTLGMHFGSRRVSQVVHILANLGISNAGSRTGPR